jgi:hypothetical protein
MLATAPSAAKVAEAFAFITGARTASIRMPPNSTPVASSLRALTVSGSLGGTGAETVIGSGLGAVGVPLGSELGLELGLPHTEPS